MKVAIESDKRTSLTDFVAEELKRQGHEVELFGILKDEPVFGVEVREEVALSVAKGYVRTESFFVRQERE